MTAPPGWVELRFDCAAKCDGCPFSFGVLWRGFVGGREVYLCEGCRRRATGEEE